MNTRAITKLPWPENLLRLIFKYEGYDEWKTNIPPDFEESFAYVLEETLTERETYILYSFYRDRIPLRTIGERYSIQAERCRQIKDKAIRKLRHPSRTGIIRLGLAESSKPRRDDPKEVYQKESSIDELDISVRAFCSIKRANINTIKDLCGYSRSQLMKKPNIGVRSIDEIERKLNLRGLSLKQDDL